MKNESEMISRLRSYGPLWDGWNYNGKYYGSGGSGCVLGLSRGYEKSVVKVSFIEDNQQKYNTVKDEIETMITLRSEFLVECLDYRIEEVFNRKGEKIGYDFLIHMNEYEPFSEFLREEEYDPNEVCVQLAKEIGGALCVLHSNGILHRDIKPENIFIDNSSGERHFRLGDFGVSKRIGDMSGLTTTGTLNFMAPESFKYYEYSYRSDIYNLGMTLYYILNDLRFPVFTEEESQSDFDYNTDCRLHGEKLPKPIYGSDMLIKVVIKCCEANPKDRYKDISEILNVLFDQNIPSIGMKHKDVVTSHTRKKAVRKKRLYIALIVASSVIVVTLGLFTFFIFRPISENKNLKKFEPTVIATDVKTSNDRVEDILFQCENKSHARNTSVILRMSDSSINKKKSSESYYDCYFWDDYTNDYGDLFYIFSEQGDASYRIYIEDNEIIRVIVGGKNVETYDYGSEQIDDKYKKIVEDAKKRFKELIDNNLDSVYDDDDGYIDLSSKE